MGIPYTQDGFCRLYKEGVSDFISSLKKTYNVEDADTLWKKYCQLANEVMRIISFCRNHGVDILEDLSMKDFYKFRQYDVIVMVAHHSEHSNDIEFNGKFFSETQFSENFPSDFRGILDLTSCFSTNLQYILKSRCISEEFHTIAVDNRTSLAFRLLLLRRVIEELRANDLDYFCAYEKAIGFLIKLLPDGRNIKKRDIVYLGGKMRSTIFAPNEVKKGDIFIVQVFIHKDNDEETVEIVAKDVDSSTSLRNSKILPIRIRRNDKIEIELTWRGGTKSDFIIDKRRKGMIWNNEPSSLEFSIEVSPKCTISTFIGNIKIAINKQRAGEILFKTNIVDGESTNKITDNIVFSPYVKSDEMNSESKHLLKKLQEELQGLKSKLECSLNEKDKERISNELEICKRLFEIADDNSLDIDRNVVKVFISSTSDMAKYRDMLKKQITDLKMYPVSYDNWTQEDSYPRDICCKEVMASDIFVCILGAKYGFIEPEWCMSMTEIEYRVAVKSGLPILVYIIDNYEKEMQELSIDYKDEIDKQKKLIEELKSKRLVELFKSEMFLQMKSCEELTRLKTQLELGR